MQVAMTAFLKQSADDYRNAHGKWPDWYCAVSKRTTRPVAPNGRALTTAPRKKRDYEAELLAAIAADGLPTPESQYRWWPGRRFRADFAYLDPRILIEVQGGLFQKSATGDGGGHNRGAGYEADRRKYAQAQIFGWMVLEFGPNQVTSGEAIATIRQALSAQKGDDGNA